LATHDFFAKVLVQFYSLPPYRESFSIIGNNLRAIGVLDCPHFCWHKSRSRLTEAP